MDYAENVKDHWWTKLQYMRKMMDNKHKYESRCSSVAIRRGLNFVHFSFWSSCANILMFASPHICLIMSFISCLGYLSSQLSGLSSENFFFLQSFGRAMRLIFQKCNVHTANFLLLNLLWFSKTQYISHESATDSQILKCFSICVAISCVQFHHILKIYRNLLLCLAIHSPRNNNA